MVQDIVILTSNENYEIAKCEYATSYAFLRDYWKCKDPSLINIQEHFLGLSVGGRWIDGIDTLDGALGYLCVIYGEACISADFFNNAASALAVDIPSDAKIQLHRGCKTICYGNAKETLKQYFLSNFGSENIYAIDIGDECTFSSYFMDDAVGVLFIVYGATLMRKACPDLLKTLQADGIQQLNLSSRAYRILWRYGIYTVSALKSISYFKLLSWRGIGSHTINAIFNALLEFDGTVLDGMPAATDLIDEYHQTYECSSDVVSAKCDTVGHSFKLHLHMLDADTDHPCIAVTTLNSDTPDTLIVIDTKTGKVNIMR